MKSRAQEEEIRRLREALNSGNPVNQYVRVLNALITDKYIGN